MNHNTILKQKFIRRKLFNSFLDSEADFFTFQTFDDNSKRKDRQLARVLHGTLDEHYQELCHLQSKGAGVFITINETNGQGRAAQHILKVRALFVDLDGSPLEPILSAPIEPHLIVESSPNRYHVYWFINDCPLGRFSAIQKQLAERFKGDSCVHDLARVMRLVGFIHQKYEAYQTRVIEDRCTLPIPFSEFEAKFGLQIDPIDFSPIKEDEIIKTLKAKGMIKKEDQYPGCYSITCPWLNHHSTGDDLGTKYYAAGYNGYTLPGFKCFHTHCKDKSIKDLIKFLELKITSHVNEQWDDPIPLPEGLPPVATFDEVLLPNAIRPWILDIADRMQIPPDFSASSSLVVAGSLIGRRCGIYPKEKDDWLVVPNIWGAVIGRPALLKSPAISEIMKPLNHIVANAVKQYQLEMEAFEGQKLVREAIRGALKDDLKKAAKKKDTTQSDLEAIVNAGQDSLDDIPIPIERRYKTEDGTIEKIGEILNQNSEGILIHRDELMGWLKSLDRYGREGDRAFYLESWNGTGGFTVDSNAFIDKVPESYALRAAAWCDYLESHAYRLYSSAQHPSIEAAPELLKRIQSGDIRDGFSLRDIYRKEWSKLTTPDEVKQAVDVLIDYGWVKLEQPFLMKKQLYRLHPSLRRQI